MPRAIVQRQKGADTENEKRETSLPIIDEELRKLNECLERIERNQQTILCCALLPKDGPNWMLCQKLFKNTELMLQHGPDGLIMSLEERVKDILLTPSNS